MTWTVVFHGLFDAEFMRLPTPVRTALAAKARLLEAFGPALGRPHVDTLKMSKHDNMKELRFDAADGVWRVAFAFDPDRQAVILVAATRPALARSGSIAGSSRSRTLVSTSTFRAHVEAIEMARTLDEVIGSLPLAEQREIEAQAAVLIEQELTLRDLRRAHELTQARLAEALNISQDGVSRIEKRSDFLLSTLRSYVEAMGGRLRLVAEFPDRAPVAISGVGSLEQPSKGKEQQQKR